MSEYCVVITGVQNQRPFEQVVADLAKSIGQQIPVVAPKLRQGFWLLATGLPKEMAGTYQTMLREIGCVSEIRQIDEVVVAQRGALDFSGLALKNFIGLNANLMLSAPSFWQDSSDDTTFQVVDPATNTQFTAVAFEKNLSLQEWASLRFQANQRALPFLSKVDGPEAVIGANWDGLIEKYRGIFPGNNYESDYCNVCFCTGKVVFSISVAAEVAHYRRHESLYRWLLQNQLYVLTKMQSPGTG